MKKIVLATVLGFGLVSASWAAETVNIHERVNNAQAPAHQIQSASVPSAVQGQTSRMAGMNQHEQAIIAHETMNNGQSGAHQAMAEAHRRMINAG
ncbi:TPA: hypothetical protein ACGK0H_003487 [Salmonella enterica subsp. enterica serovar Typhimurium]